jgi:phosphate transport system ATP-binding protein
MNDLVDNCNIKGEILYHDKNLYSPGTDVVLMRKKIGMVFQHPNPFPKSIYDNIAYGPRVHGVKDKKVLDEKVEKSLRRAALWGEVHERLHEPAMGLSGALQGHLQ